MNSARPWAPQCHTCGASCMSGGLILEFPVNLREDSSQFHPSTWANVRALQACTMHNFLKDTITYIYIYMYFHAHTRDKNWIISVIRKELNPFNAQTNLPMILKQSFTKYSSECCWTISKTKIKTRKGFTRIVELDLYHHEAIFHQVFHEPETSQLFWNQGGIQWIVRLRQPCKNKIRSTYMETVKNWVVRFSAWPCAMSM